VSKSGRLIHAESKVSVIFFQLRKNEFYDPCKTQFHFACKLTFITRMRNKVSLIL